MVEECSYSRLQSLTAEIEQMCIVLAVGVKYGQPDMETLENLGKICECKLCLSFFCAK